MSRRKLERLLNLTMCLMATSRFLPVEEIGRLVDGYDVGGTPEDEAAFRRMFERDKDDLRELGIPLETGSDDAWDDGLGYRIRRSDYALPEIAFDADEAAALGLAARLWSSAALADAGASALRKLSAGGVAVRPGPEGLEPRVDAVEPAFGPCLAAVRDGRALSFGYRRPNDAEPARRRVEPWGVVSWRGRWYLVGWDRDRRAERVFRLSRFVGPAVPTGPAGAVTPPPDVDLRAMVADSDPRADARTATARLWVRRGAGNALRRYARSVTPAPADGVPPGPADVLELSYADVGRMASWVVGYGADVAVLGPPDLRAAVVDRLRAGLAAGVAGAAAG